MNLPAKSCPLEIHRAAKEIRGLIDLGMISEAKRVLDQFDSGEPEILARISGFVGYIEAKALGIGRVGSKSLHYSDAFGAAVIRGGGCSGNGRFIWSRSSWRSLSGWV